MLRGVGAEVDARVRDEHLDDLLYALGQQQRAVRLEASEAHVAVHVEQRAPVELQVGARQRVRLPKFI